jgi:hypothetical protein
MFSLALAVLLGWATPGRAAVRFDMFVGFDGVVPQGSWFPITFEVQNDGPPFVATVEVSPGQFDSGQERYLKVELPTDTTKRFSIPVFGGVSWNPNWSARLLDEKRRVRAVVENPNIKRFNGGILPVAAVLSRHLPTFPETKARQENLRPAFARLQTSLLPDNPLSLDGLDMLYLSSERGMDLKANQITALLAWLHAGGHLVISVEQPSQLTGSGAWMNQVLPAQIAGLTSLDSHGALHQWVSGSQRYDGKTYDFSRSVQNQQGIGVGVNPFARLAADPLFEDAPLQVAQVRARDGSVLVGSSEAPLVITAPRGLGRITLLTFAPELEPFRTWRNAPYFWAKMADLAPELLTIEWPNRSAGRPMDSILGAMIDSRQIRKLPVGWLLVLLVAYLLVIGPLDQYWLKKLNRQMLTWLTFPAYVVFFSLLIYFIGYKLRAGETEWTELHVVDLIPHGPKAEIRGRSFGSIYSPVNARYAFANDVAFATMRGEFSGNYGNGESTRGRIEQLAQGFAGDIAVPVWTSQLFLSDWWQQAVPMIGLEVNALEVRVANRLDRPLVAAQLVIGSQMFELGEIPSGGTKTFERRRLTSQPLDSFVRSHASSFSGVASARQQVFSGNERSRIDDWTNSVLAASFLQRSAGSGYETFDGPRGFDLGPALDSGQAVLIAWAPGYSPIQPLNRFSSARVRRNTVFRVLGHLER